MPYKKRDGIKSPKDDAVLWRYMDFTKFVDLLDKRALWFARVDTFKDPFECSLSLANVLMVETLDQLDKRGLILGDEQELDHMRRRFQRKQDFVSQLREAR